MSKKEMGEFEERPEVKPAVAVPIERRKPTGLICSVVILAILVVGLAGYIVFDLVSRSGNSGDKTKCVTTSTEKNVGGAEVGDQKEILAERTGFVYSNNFSGDFYVTKDGEVYYEPIDSASYSLNPYGISLYLKKGENMRFVDGLLPGEQGTFSIKDDDLGGFSSLPNHDDVEDGFVKVVGFKLNLSNIVYVEEIEWGQQKVGSSTAFIDGDGNVSLLLVRPTDDSTTTSGANVKAKMIKNVDAYKGAVAVQQAHFDDGNSPYFLMKDGSKISIDSEMLSF